MGNASSQIVDEHFRVWKKNVTFKKAHVQHNLIQVEKSTLQRNEVYFCYDTRPTGSAYYAIYFEEECPGYYEFYECDQNTRAVNENNRIIVSRDTIVFKPSV